MSESRSSSDPTRPVATPKFSFGELQGPPKPSKVAAAVRVGGRRRAPRTSRPARATPPTAAPAAAPAPAPAAAPATAPTTTSGFSSGAATKATLQSLPQDKVAALAGQQGVTVYQYTHDTPAVVMDGETQAHCIRHVCEAFDAGCQANTTAGNEAIRETLMGVYPLLRVFQQAHPKTFASITVRVTSPEVRLRLEKARKLAMLGAVERWKGEGTEEERAARMMNIAARVSLRPTRPEDMEGGLSTQLDNVPGAPTLEPLGIDTFGGEVIHQ